MAQHRTTLKDIAEELGITVTSVSKALKDYPDISVETKKAVKKLAKKLNYQPDSRAIAMKRNKSNIIGVIIPEIVHFFFSNVIQGIMSYCDQKGYQVLIALSNNQKSLEKKQVNLMFNTRVDGLIASLANESATAKHFKILKEYNIPLVLFDKIDERFECNKVKIDDRFGAFLATEHLIAKGCKRLAHIRGPQHPLNAKERYNGFCDALKKHNLELDPALIKICEKVTLSEGYDFAKELLALDNPPDGIFTVTDQVGVGVIKAAQEMNLKIPEQLKVVGFSDSQIAQVVKPSLSTIHQPGYEIGETAARLLIEEIETREADSESPVGFKQITLDTYLIAREST